jgi:hypothetical protein
MVNVWDIVGISFQKVTFGPYVCDWLQFAIEPKSLSVYISLV